MRILKSATFDRWLQNLRDRSARGKIVIRIDRLASGNPGDVKGVGHGISELRIDHGPGCVNFMRRNRSLAILLFGGDKSSQVADIKMAQAIAEQWKK